MNCKQVQELLPLFVGHDLEEKRERMVAAHLQSCLACIDDANDFRETRQLLREWECPPIRQEVYSEIRWRVLGQIEAESTRVSSPRLIPSLFRPRLAWALASGLIVVLMLAVFFTANRREVEPVLVEKQPMVQPNVNREPEQRLSVQKLTPIQSKHQLHVKQKQWIEVRRFQPRKNRDLIIDRGTEVAGSTPQTILAEPALFPARDSAASEKTLRMDIQTKNPNIRIIWFSQPNTKLELPGSKG